MLLLLGPDFAGTSEQYTELAELTGLVAYDLRTKLKPGSWGVLRTLGSSAQARRLAAGLRGVGYPVVAVDSSVAYDSNRRLVSLEALDLDDNGMTLHLNGQSMTVPYKALSTIVEGEIQVTGSAPPPRPSSARFRVVAPTPTEVQLFRESTPQLSFEVHPVADLHFATVLWAARVDARHFDFSILQSPDLSPSKNISRLVALLAEHSSASIDRGHKVSSLASFAARPPSMRSLSAAGTTNARLGTGDVRFDAYSRLVAEAERLSREAPRPASLPPDE